MDTTDCANKVVLIVEDDTLIRESLALLMNLAGIRVVQAANGQEALEFLRNNPPPCLILLDLMMPVMDGWQFLETRRLDPRLAEIPVLVCSAVAHLGPQQPLADIAGVETKPIDPVRLIDLAKRYTYVS